MQTNYEKRVAYHEAGHALVHHLEGMETESVTIIPGEDEWSGKFDGMHMSADPIEFDDGYDFEFKQETAEKIIRILYAGAEAERLVYGEGEPEGTDKEKLGELIMGYAPVNSDGIADGTMYADQAAAMLEAYRPALEALAEALMEKKTLTGDETKALLLEHGVPFGSQNDSGL